MSTGAVSSGLARSSEHVFVQGSGRHGRTQVAAAAAAVSRRRARRASAAPRPRRSPTGDACSGPSRSSSSGRWAPASGSGSSFPRRSAAASALAERRSSSSRSPISISLGPWSRSEASARGRGYTRRRPCADGGIGRRARLRAWSGITGWRFESSSAHLGKARSGGAFVVLTPSAPRPRHLRPIGSSTSSMPRGARRSRRMPDHERARSNRPGERARQGRDRMGRRDGGAAAPPTREAMPSRPRASGAAATQRQHALRLRGAPVVRPPSLIAASHTDIGLGNDRPPDDDSARSPRSAAPDLLAPRGRSTCRPEDTTRARTARTRAAARRNRGPAPALPRHAETHGAYASRDQRNEPAAAGMPFGDHDLLPPLGGSDQLLAVSRLVHVHPHG